MAKIVKQLKRSDAKNWPKIVRIAMSKLWLHTDGDLIFEIKTDEGTRSVKLNRLLFLWHGEFKKHIYDSTGQVHSSYKIHEFVVNEVLDQEVLTVGDKSIIIRATTRKMSNKEFCKFLIKYEIWADERGCVFSQPSDLYFDALMIQLNNEKTAGE